MKREYSNEEQGVVDFSPNEIDEAQRFLQSTTGKYEIFFVPTVDRFFVASVQKLFHRLPQRLLRRRVEMSEKRIEKVLELLIDEDVFAEVDRNIEFDNAQFRADFFKQEKCFTSADIHKISGQGGSNKSMPASRWKNEGRIFAVSFCGQDYFPEFQLREGEPQPAIQKILSVLPEDMTPWQIAFWFTSENGWLNGQRPCDTINDAQAVIKAAEVEGESVIG